MVMSMSFFGKGEKGKSSTKSNQRAIQVIQGNQPKTRRTRSVEIDDFIEFYVKHARRFAPFRDNAHRLMAATLIGFATRNWWNPITKRRGNRLFLFVIAPTNTGKSYVFYEVPRNILDEKAKSFGLELVGTFSVQKLGETVERTKQARLFYINEFTGALTAWADILPEFVIGIYDGYYRYTTKTTQFELTGEKGRCAFITATTPSRLGRALRDGKVITSLDLISSGFLPRFILVGLEPYTEEEQDAITVFEIDNEKAMQHPDIADWLLEKTGQNKRVCYTSGAKQAIRSLSKYWLTKDLPDDELVSRMNHHLAALAANIAIAQNRLEVTEDDIERANKLIEQSYDLGVKYLREALGVSSQRERVTTDKVLALIARSSIEIDGVTVPAAIKKRELNKKLLNYYGLTRREREDILSILIDSGEVVAGELRREKAGRPATVYCLLTNGKSCDICPLRQKGICAPLRGAKWLAP